MIRISPETSKNLDELAKTTGKSKQFLVEKAVQAYIRDQFLKKTNEEYAKLKQDKKNHGEFLKEINEWDITLQDGFLNDD